MVRAGTPPRGVWGPPPPPGPGVVRRAEGWGGLLGPPVSRVARGAAIRGVVVVVKASRVSGTPRGVAEPLHTPGQVLRWGGGGLELWALGAPTPPGLPVGTYRGAPRGPGSHAGPGHVPTALPPPCCYPHGLCLWGSLSWEGNLPREGCRGGDGTLLPPLPQGQGVLLAGSTSGRESRWRGQLPLSAWPGRNQQPPRPGRLFPVPGVEQSGGVGVGDGWAPIPVDQAWCCGSSPGAGGEKGDSPFCGCTQTWGGGGDGQPAGKGGLKLSLSQCRPWVAATGNNPWEPQLPALEQWGGGYP